MYTEGEMALYFFEAVSTFNIGGSMSRTRPFKVGLLKAEDIFTLLQKLGISHSFPWHFNKMIERCRADPFLFLSLPWDYSRFLRWTVPNNLCRDMSSTTPAGGWINKISRWNSWPCLTFTKSPNKSKTKKKASNWVFKKMIKIPAFGH